MSKAQERAFTRALNLAVSLRRAVVDCRFERNRESDLLDRTSDLITALEDNQTADTETIQETA